MGYNKISTQGMRVLILLRMPLIPASEKAAILSAAASGGLENRLSDRVGSA